MSKTQPAAPEKIEMNSRIFEGGFGEYLHFTRSFTERQKSNLFDSLPEQERLFLKKSLEEEGWTDVVRRNQIGLLIDQVEKEHNINLIEARCKVLKGKSVYLPKTLWEMIILELEYFIDEHKHFVVGGIKGVVCKQYSEIVLLVPANSQKEE